MGENVGRRLRSGWELLRESGRSFSRDRGALVSAAIGFYTLLALAPLLFVTLAFVGRMLATETERQRLASELGEVLGYEPSGIITEWLLAASRAPGILSAVAIAIALFMSTRLFGQIQQALNEIWGVERKRPASFGGRLGVFLRRRLVAFVMLAGSGLMVLLLVVARAAAHGLRHELFEGTAWTRTSVDVVQTFLSILAVAVIAAVSYRVLPDRDVPWRSAWTGALLASVLFNVGILLFGAYVGWIARAQTLGAAGAFVFLLVWLYYSAQTFMLGAELTHTHAESR